MTAISIHIDEATELRLRAIADELQRDVHELAESAVAEAALDFFRARHLSADPARHQRSDVQEVTFQ